MSSSIIIKDANDHFIIPFARIAQWKQSNVQCLKIRFGYLKSSVGLSRLK